MTYDVQRWAPMVTDNDLRMVRYGDGKYVLAADAEAHEKAAVEQAIRDCQDVIGGLKFSSLNEALRADEALHSLLSAFISNAYDPAQRDNVPTSNSTNSRMFRNFGGNHEGP